MMNSPTLDFRLHALSSIKYVSIASRPDSFLGIIPSHPRFMSAINNIFVQAETLTEKIVKDVASRYETASFRS